MGNKDKKKLKRLSSQHKPNTYGIQEYDLAMSLEKVRPYTRQNKRHIACKETFSKDKHSNIERKGYVSSESSLYDDRTTGSPSWDRYDRLEDRFTSFTGKNEKEHTALRQELENKIEKSSDGIRNEIKDLSKKIDKKVSKWFLGAAISTLIAIVGIIWALSYQYVVNLPKELIKIDGRIEKMENVLNEQKPLVDSVMNINTRNRNTPNR